MNADWVMVIITGVYVIATIFICWANIKAANASKEQLREMQKQFAETNRPIIELEFHYSRRTWYIARFVNRGNLSAQHVKINLDQEFIDSLPEESMKKELERIKGKECIIGAGQHYDLYIGSNKLRGNLNMKPLTGTIEYGYDMPYLNEEIIYSLRNCLLHQSTPNVEQSRIHESRCKVDKFELVITGEDGANGDLSMVAYGKDMNMVRRELKVHISHLCYILCTAAEDYYKNNKEKFDFIKYSIEDDRPKTFL